MRAQAKILQANKTAVTALLLFCGAVLAADDELPDAEFLEYLGMWEESDEEWLVFEDDDSLLVDAETEPETDASVEINDEG